MSLFIRTVGHHCVGLNKTLKKKQKIKDPAGSSRRESDIPKREIEKTENIKREYQSSDSIKVEKSEKKQSRSSKRPLPIPGKDLPKDQPIRNVIQITRVTTLDMPQ